MLCGKLDASTVMVSEAIGPPGHRFTRDSAMGSYLQAPGVSRESADEARQAREADGYEDQDDPVDACWRCCMKLLTAILIVFVVLYVVTRKEATSTTTTRADIVVVGHAADHDCGDTEAARLMIRNAWDAMDTDEDSALSPEELIVGEQLKELSPQAISVVRTSDANHNNRIDRDEFYAGLTHAGGLMAGTSSDGPVFTLGDPKVLYGSWSGKRKAWCCEHEAVACSEATGPAPDADAVYDCSQGRLDWKKQWTPQKKAACCGKEDDMDCSIECHQECIFEHRSASCIDRVKWAAGHGFVQSTDACPAAWLLVMQQCPVCAGCQLKDTGCTHAVPETTSKLPYNCLDGYTSWAEAWSSDKKRWCCQEYSRGCETTMPAAHAAATTEAMTTAHPHQPSTSAKPTEPPDSYECSKGGYFDWESSWTRDKKEWCCQHRNTGCPEDAV